MSSTPRTYRLPDLHSICHWKASFNPHYDEARAASSAWVLSYNVFTGKKLEFFKQGGSELLCAWAYPYAGVEQLRTACDFVNLLFTIDEISDEQSGKDAVDTGLIVLNTMKDDKYDDGSVLCKMTKECVLHYFASHTPIANISTALRHVSSPTVGRPVCADSCGTPRTTLTVSPSRPDCARRTSSLTSFLTTSCGVRTAPSATALDYSATSWTSIFQTRSLSTRYSCACIWPPSIWSPGLTYAFSLFLPVPFTHFHVCRMCTPMTWNKPWDTLPTTL